MKKKQFKSPFGARKMSRAGPQDYIVAVLNVYFIWHEVITTRFLFFRFHWVTYWHLLASSTPACGVLAMK